jgi:hypothetical protein
MLRNQEDARMLTQHAGRRGVVMCSGTGLGRSSPGRAIHAQNGAPDSGRGTAVAAFINYNFVSVN